MDEGQRKCDEVSCPRALVRDHMNGFHPHSLDSTKRTRVERANHSTSPYKELTPEADPRGGGGGGFAGTCPPPLISPTDVFFKMSQSYVRMNFTFRLWEIAYTAFHVLTMLGYALPGVGCAPLIRIPGSAPVHSHKRCVLPKSDSFGQEIKIELVIDNESRDLQLNNDSFLILIAKAELCNFLSLSLRKLKTEFLPFKVTIYIWYNLSN